MSTTPVATPDAGRGVLVPPVAPPSAPVGTDESPGRARKLVHAAAVVVLVIGLAATAALSLGAASVHRSNEKRLLRQRAREVSAVVTASIPNLQTPMSSAATLADATNGNKAAFRRFVEPLIASHQFVSVSLWAAKVPPSGPLTVEGARPELEDATAGHIGSLLVRAQASKTIVIENLFNAPDRRIGYALASTATKPPQFVVYAENSLPKDRRARVDTNSAFGDLDYALFLGTRPDDSQLLASSTGGAKLRGETQLISSPFADSHLTIVISARKELGGSLLARLPLILLLGGLAMTAGAVSLVEILSRRRAQAEALAEENGRLYADQRFVAQTLQHSLLAEVLPEIAELEISARYISGVEGIDIGGDWYDVVPIDDDHVVIVVGDVSGRGLHAATMMASLRFATRAYAAQRDSPGKILNALSNLVSIRREGHFATVLCGLVDLPEHTITWANAGHLQPLLINASAAPQYVTTPRGVPIGVQTDAHYEEFVTTVGSRATLLLYTDGLVERRSEDLDAGLQRLSDAATASRGTLDDVLTAVVAGTIPSGSDDDAALIGVRWRS